MCLIRCKARLSEKWKSWTRVIQASNEHKKEGISYIRGYHLNVAGLIETSILDEEINGTSFTSTSKERKEGIFPVAYITLQDNKDHTWGCKLDYKNAESPPPFCVPFVQQIFTPEWVFHPNYQKVLDACLVQPVGYMRVSVPLITCQSGRKAHGDGTQQVSLPCLVNAVRLHWSSCALHDPKTGQLHPYRLAMTRGEPLQVGIPASFNVMSP